MTKLLPPLFSSVPRNGQSPANKALVELTPCQIAHRREWSEFWPLILYIVRSNIVDSLARNGIDYHASEVAEMVSEGISHSFLRFLQMRLSKLSTDPKATAIVSARYGARRASAGVPFIAGRAGYVDALNHSHSGSATEHLVQQGYQNPDDTEESRFAQLERTIISLPQNCRKVARLLGAGLSRAQVALRLDISLPTVDRRRMEIKTALSGSGDPVSVVICSALMEVLTTI